MNKKTLIISISVVLLLAGVFLTLYFTQSRTDSLLSQLEEDEVSGKKLPEATLTFYFNGSEPRETREVLDQIESKLRNTLNIKLIFKFINTSPEAYLENIKNLTASKQACDVFYYSDSFFKGLQSLAQDGLARDITADFPRHAPNYYRSFSQEELKAASVDGRIYIIPQRVPSSQTRCAIVREDLMNKYHLRDIQNYDDFEAYLKAVKTGEPGMIPLTYYDTTYGLFAEPSGYVMLNYPLGLVYRLDDPVMKIIAWEQTPEFRKGVETISRWYNSGYLLKGMAVAPPEDTVISSGKWASYIGSWGTDVWWNSVLQSRNITWRYKAYPLSPAANISRDWAINGALVIHSKSKNAARVLQFINWIQSKQENYDTFMYGIKGKHYLLEDQSVKLPTGIEQEQSFYNWAWRWPLRNINWERLDSSSSMDAQRDYYTTLKTKAKFPPHLGFVPDFGPVSDIVNIRQLSYYDIDLQIYSGTNIYQNLDAYIQEKKQQGADKLVAEIQRQLDKWRTRKK
ncbi:MAG TPA: extracellular solute-binding protein [Bacillota bacterium]|nr:extracellular solute-binding protein [Bacillota bacterium]